VVLRRGGHRYSTSQYLPTSSTVKSVAWVKLDSAEIAVVGCEDGRVYLWNVQNEDTVEICKHGDSIVYLSAILCDDVIYIVSSGADSVVKVHCSKTNQISEHSSITLPRQGFAHSVSVTRVHGAVILAMGTDDSSVSLYHISDSETILLTKLTGHEDWVRGLDFRSTETGCILASGSQDHYIRLWKIELVQEDLDAKGFKLKEKLFQIQNRKYRLTLDNILLSHENFVTSVKWMSNGMLLSSSMDKTLIVWQQDTEGMWTESVHVGEVGGNNLGLYGAFPTADCALIVSHGFQGALQAWRSTEEGWVGVPMPGGHFGPVKDLSWAPSGDYLISASTDQSVRVCGEWQGQGWYELARSQVHGHDLSCASFISDSTYFSGSEEKVLRVFQATSTFFSNVNAITGSNIVPTVPGVIGAHIPALGLSNKAITPEDMKSAVEHTGTANVKDYDIPYQVAFAPATLVEPPLEEVLLQNTLWPELHKLYGHGYEVYQCAASPDGRILASSCRATQLQFAAVILWEAGTWTKLAELQHHTLTVTRMKFSPDSRYLVTVSRDRDWAVWDIPSHSLLTTSPSKAHSRIIWDCAWFGDSSSFATVSRDKKLKVWDEDKSEGKVAWREACSRTFQSSVTAVDISPRGLILLGFETGDICVVERRGHVIELLSSLPRHQCATLTINTVQWRPGQGKEEEEVMFAACSDDNSMLINTVSMALKVPHES